MKALSLYIDKWYIVGAVVDNNGSHPLSLPNAEERVWLYFYNDMEANRVRYSKSYKREALANAMNYYSDIFSLIPRCKEKNYKWYGSDKPMKTIFEDAGIFADLRGGFDEKEKMPTYIVFSSDICLESQSIFKDLLRENGFEIKQFVAHIEDLAVEYAYKRGKAGHKYVLVANACNENLHYALYHQQEGQFIQVGNGKTLYGKGEDARKYAIVEQVIDIINAGSRLLSDDEERQKEHQYLSQFADRWLSLIDDNDAKATPLGNICFSKQKNNRYPVSVLKSDIDKRTDAAVDEIVSEMVKIVEGSDIQNHEVSHVLLIGDSFDNGQFMLNLQKRFAISDDKFIHIHERELAPVVGIYRELPANSFNAEEKEFEENVKEEVEQTTQIFRDSLKNLKQSAEDAERRGEYDDALGYFREVLQLSPMDINIKEKIRNLENLIKENKEKSKRYNEHIAKANTAYDIKNWDEAISQCNQALREKPNSEEAIKLSKRIMEMKERYAKLEEYLVKIDTLVEHGDYDSAKKEIDKVSSLGLKDQRLVALNNKIKQIEAEKQKQIRKVSEALNSCLISHRYDEAMTHVNTLLNIDKEHCSIWNEKITEIRQEQIQGKLRLEKIASLKTQIDIAWASSNWREVAVLCEKYLSKEENTEIKNIKEQAEEKLILRQQQVFFDKAVNMQDWQQVIDLDRAYPMLHHNTDNARIIKNARRLLSLERRNKNTHTIEIPIGGGETVPDTSGITPSKRKQRFPKPRTSTKVAPVNEMDTVSAEPISTKKIFPIPHRVTDTREGENDVSANDNSAQIEDRKKKRKFPRPSKK